MFLSDQLYEMGKQSNPKNNLSQSEACEKMHQLLLVRLNQGENSKALMYSTKNAVERLNKEGWKYFKVELFFETTKKS